MQTILRKVFIALLVMTSSAVSAQRAVSGTITDGRGTPLIGASVSLKHRPHTGTTTDTKGHYTLVIPAGEDPTLQVSYIGYIPRTGKPSIKTNRLDLALNEDETGLQTVVITGTRTPKLLKDAPIVTKVISADRIKKTDATHIGELLQAEIPGIEFSYAMDQQVTLNMQGFGGNSVLFLQDGERIAGETLDNIDYNRLSMDNVERIEIVKGAASSLYGSNAVGGVVNVITRDATEPWTANLNARIGAHNNQRYGGSFSFKSGKFNSITNLQHTHADAIDLGRDGDYSTVFGNKTWNIKERLTFNATDRLNFTGRAGYYFRERDKSADIKNRYRSFSGGIKGRYSFAGGKDDMEVAYSFDQYDKSDLIMSSRNDIRDYSNVQNSLRALYNHKIGRKNMLTLGGDYMRDYLMSYQFEANGSKRQYTFDAFAQADLHLTDKLSAIAGLRYDYYSEARANNLSSKLGMMYKVDNCSLRGSYSGGFRAPTLKEMYMSFDMASIFMIYGNENLKPERSHNFSLSAEYIKGRCSVTVTGYYNKVDNRITTAWNKALNSMQYVNMAPLKISGFDVNAQVKYPCGFGASASYAYTHEHIKAGEPLTSSTRPHTATARIEYDRQWKSYGFCITLIGRFLSGVTTDEYTSVSSYEETSRQRYPGYAMWKLSLAQRIAKGVNITLAADNLLNYRPSYYYNNSPSTTGTTLAAGISVDIDKLFK